ncbi:MAG: FMN-binding protein [Anaerorhabdus sp.]
MKKIVNGLLCALLVLGVSACSSSSSNTSGLTDGQYSSVQQGFGGEITVEITIENREISTAKITGEDETESIGQAAFPTLEEAIVSGQGVDVDVVSGATVTSEAVLAGVQDCLNQASGTAVAELKMADGVYTASAWSFSTTKQLTVSVEVKDNKMQSIEVVESGDTEIILNTAIEYLIPDMVENQSVRLDSTTGATISSSAIKTAVEDCLVQAIEAAEGDTSAISNFYVASVKSTEEVTLETDILVVGLGGSGMATATRAVETLFEAYGGDTTQYSVLGIDKAAKYGGTSVTTSSPMSVNPSTFVEANGGEDYVDAAELKAAWLEYTEGDAKEWAIDVMMEESGPAVDWLIEQGFVFGAPIQGLSAPYEICVNYGDQFQISKSIVQTYFDSLMSNYESMGGEYMLNIEATDLILDETGKTVGVNATGSDGVSYTIYADTVVLATGGFAGSGEMEDEYLSDEYYDLSGGGLYNLYGMAQNDGKMIASAIENGAATYNIGMPPLSHIGGAYKIMHEYPVEEAEGTNFLTGEQNTKSLNDIPMMLSVAPNALAVNREGVRFTDETTLAAYGNWQSGAYYYTIWSDETIKEIQENGLEFDTIGIFINQGGWPTHTAIPEIYDVLETGIEMDYIYKADTLEELAELIGVDPSTLVTTVANYNEYCETKENPADGIEKNPVIYGLSGAPVEGDYDVYNQVGTGPYYAIKGSPWIYSTAAALDINEEFQVLGTDGEAMQGLYAVGTDTLGIMFTEKKEYVTYGGADQGWAFTSGFLAGKEVAEELIEANK